MQREELVGTTLGHYRLQRVAGVGGMATVFMGEDLHLGRQIAVKVFQQDFQQPEESRAFLREARVLAQLDHPHILRVYDYGEESGLAYLVMPFMTQGSLQDLLRQQRILPVQTAVSLLIQVLHGLAYAHKRGLVHRDIKPGNMLFKADRSLLLSDFGIAKVVAQPVGLHQLMLTSATTTNRIIGTPAYMAPEQAERHATSLSDLYSMGVVLYEMVTGSRPFQAAHPMALFMKHLTEAPRPPRLLNPDIPEELEQAILQALAKEPARRFPDAPAFIQTLEQILAQERERSAAPTQTGSRNAGAGISSEPTIDQTELTRNAHGPVQTGEPTPPTQTAMVALSDTLPPFLRTEGASGVHPSRPMETRQPRAVRWLIPGLLVLILLATPGIYFFATGRLARTPASAQSSPPTKKLAEVPTITPTLADCPASGQARKASLPNLTTGSAPALVYLAMTGLPTAPSASRLELWNMRTKKTTLVATFLNALLSQVLISPDGKWLLFSLGVQNKQKLELMRIDGQDLQTLYCSGPQGTLEEAGWSPDQQRIVFADVNAAHTPTLLLLTVNNGLLETISTDSGFSPVSWMDQTHLLTEYSSSQDSPPVLLLANMDQYQPGKTEHISGGSPVSFQFAFQLIPLDVSTLESPPQFLCPPRFAGGKEANQIFVMTCAANGTGVNEGPSTISLETYPQWNAPGHLTTIYTSDTQFFAAFWVVSSTTLLVEVQNTDRFRTVFPTNGLWKVTLNTQSGGPASAQQLTRSLFPDGWPASRDGTLYAVSEQGRDLASNTPTSQLLVGSLTGGAPTPVVSASGENTLVEVGWTTI